MQYITWIHGKTKQTKELPVGEALEFPWRKFSGIPYTVPDNVTENTVVDELESSPVSQLDPGTAGDPKQPQVPSVQVPQGSKFTFNGKEYKTEAAMKAAITKAQNANL